MEDLSHRHYTVFEDCSSSWLKFHLGIQMPSKRYSKPKPVNQHPRPRLQPGHTQHQQHNQQQQQQQISSLSLRINAAGKIKPTMVNMPSSGHRWLVYYSNGHKNIASGARNGVTPERKSPSQRQTPPHYHYSMHRSVSDGGNDKIRSRSAASWNADNGDDGMTKQNQKRPMEMVTTTPVRLLGMLRPTEHPFQWNNGEKQSPRNTYFPPVNGRKSSDSCIRPETRLQVSHVSPRTIQRRKEVINATYTSGYTAPFIEGNGVQKLSMFLRSSSTESLPNSWKFMDRKQADVTGANRISSPRSAEDARSDTVSSSVTSNDALGLSTIDEDGIVYDEINHNIRVNISRSSSKLSNCQRPRGQDSEEFYDGKEDEADYDTDSFSDYDCNREEMQYVERNDSADRESSDESYYNRKNKSQGVSEILEMHGKQFPYDDDSLEGERKMPDDQSIYRDDYLDLGSESTADTERRSRSPEVPEGKCSFDERNDLPEIKAKKTIGETDGMKGQMEAINGTTDPGIENNDSGIDGDEENEEAINSHVVGDRCEAQEPKIEELNAGCKFTDDDEDLIEENTKVMDSFARQEPSSEDAVAMDSINSLQETTRFSAKISDPVDSLPDDIEVSDSKDIPEQSEERASLSCDLSDSSTIAAALCYSNDTLQPSARASESHETSTSTEESVESNTSDSRANGTFVDEFGPSGQNPNQPVCFDKDLRQSYLNSDYDDYDDELCVSPTHSGNEWRENFEDSDETTPASEEARENPPDNIEVGNADPDETNAKEDDSSTEKISRRRSVRFSTDIAMVYHYVAMTPTEDGEIADFEVGENL